jgi:quinol monooxygenase YgiN
MAYKQGARPEQGRATSWVERPGGAATFLFRTASFVARPDAIADCRRTVEAFVAYINENEGSTRFIGSFQDHEDPSRFLLVMVFDDERAERAHRSSLAYRRFANDIARASVAEMRAQQWSPHAGI